MTRNNGRPVSMVDEMEHDPAGALELAAARSAVQGSALLSRTFAASGLTQKELAQKVGVTEGRVSQILNEPVNLRLSTLGRYLQAMGFRLRLGVTRGDVAEITGLDAASVDQLADELATLAR